MNQIADLLSASNIALDVEVPTKARLFEAAGALFAASASLDGAMVAASLTAREKLGSTGLARALPSLTAASRASRWRAARSSG